MKGIVFNLLEQAIGAEHGEDMWDDLLEATGLEGAYTSLGNYADEQLVRLLKATSGVLGRSADEVERWLGRSAMGPLSKLYPDFFTPHSGTKAFVLTLNEIIHPEVRKLYPGADVPVFSFESRSEAQLSVGYSSARKMCAFAEGLIQGAAVHYGEQVIIEQSRCMHRGDEVCTLDCSFGPESASG